MATKLPTSVFQRLFSRPSPLRRTQERTCSLQLRSQWRAYSSEPAPPPLLAKMKGDLKAAMRAKDATRLAVLRAILAATLNASKTASPIKTDAQLVALLRKTARASQEAVDGFRNAGREDLVEKEDAQIKVLLEYVSESGITSVDEAALREMATQSKVDIVADGANVNVGELMKRLLAPGGPLEGKYFEKATLAKIAKEVAV
ncbi:Yqey-like protein-domain-containing protein [Apodospora peruviana]|uniref:Altered inheritance of mitochondria protein 41 n=1 Tax=Apodospora peruviana TaxID=516989 RepID=A0AAE0I4D1_9PEZI|nr:Yqey-like protein-domain-containing protein [Apodospora peruviana]